MNIGIKGKIIAKTISTFYTVIKPIRNFNYNIFIYLLNNHFNNYKKLVISNNTIKNISDFWIIYIFVKFFLLINRGDRFKHWDTFKEIVIINNYVKKVIGYYSARQVNILEVYCTISLLVT